MKKTILFLGAVLALAACSKTVTVVDETPNAISINPVSGTLTRGPEFTDPAFPTDNSWLIYVGASTSENSSFFKDQMFSYITADTKWEASSAAGTHAAVYWPLGGATVDFLAYAKPAASTIAPTFDNTKPASKFTVDLSAPGTAADLGVDFMYATANGYKNQAAAVPMEFKHAQALVIFNVKRPAGGGAFAVSEISFGDKVTSATLEVNNEKNNVELKWTAPSETELIVPAAAAATTVSTLNTGVEATGKKYGDEIAVDADKIYQLGESFIVIPQPASNFTITYTLNSQTYEFEANVERLNWEAGKAYIYTLIFSNNEIIIAPTVKEWEPENVTAELS